MIKRVWLLCALAVILAACGTSAEHSAVPLPPGPIRIADQSQLLDAADSLPEVGQVAPDFQYSLPDGKTARLSDLHGKKVLLNFWASWCGPCEEEMPDLERVQRERGDDLVIIGVNKGEQATAVRTFVDKVPVSFQLVLDPQSTIAYRYGARNLPMSYFINSDGTIGLTKLGVMNYAFISRQIDRLQ